jgi:hypothetical protein
MPSPDSPATRPAKVFLSYSSTDAALAKRLAIDLRAAKVDVWLDQWVLKIGEAFEQTIKSGVDDAQFVIVLLTRASVQSRWVRREWSRKVLDEARRRRVGVVPVRGERCEIPDFLAQRSHADISGGSYRMGLRRLLEILRHHSEDAGIVVPGTVLPEGELDMATRPIVVPIVLEVSHDLTPIFDLRDDGTNRFLHELAPRMLDELAAEFGFPFPHVTVRGNRFDMPPGSAVIMIEEVPESPFRIGADDVVVDGPLDAIAALGVRWEVFARTQGVIAAGDHAAATAAGLGTRDAAEYLMCELQAVLRRFVALFVDIDITRQLVGTVEDANPALVSKVVPSVVSWLELANVLRRLVAEGVGVGDMGRILAAFAEGLPDGIDTVELAERARHALNAQITARFTRGRGDLSVLRLDPQIESRVHGALKRTSTGLYLMLEPQLTQDILAAIRQEVQAMGPAASHVPILTSAEIRPFVRKLVELEFPSLHALSRQDLRPGLRIRAIGTIRLDATLQRASSANSRPMP